MSSVVEKEPVGLDLGACEGHLQRFSDEQLRLEDVKEHVEPPPMRCSPSATNLLTEDGELPRSP